VADCGQRQAPPGQQIIRGAGLLTRHIGHLAEAIEPSECSNYFANAGYASIKI
jgi:hypothetical protein